MSITRKGLVVATVLILAATSLPAQAPVGRGDSAVVAVWREQLRSNDELLKAGEFRKARKRLDRVLKEMCDHIEGGDGAAPLLSLAVMLRAVSQAGLGNMRDAVWDLEISHSLHPRMQQADLTSYGDAGRRLQAAMEPDPSAPQPRFMWPGDPKITPPRKVEAPKPKYPVAQLYACLEGPIVGQAVIDETGKPLHPKLFSPAYPILGFAALDSLRDWRFEPAKADGEAITVLYNLQVNYRIPNC